MEEICQEPQSRAGWRVGSQHGSPGVGSERGGRLAAGRWVSGDIDGPSGRKDLPSLRIDNTNYDLYSVFGRFPAELGPETPSNGSGSKNGAERTQN